MKVLKVAFIFLHPFSGSLGSTVRLRELAISLSDFKVESYILTPYENDFDISDRVHVVSIGSVTKRLGISTYIYGLSKRLYYDPFFVQRCMINPFLQKSLARNLSTALEDAIKKIQPDILQVEQDMAVPTALELKKKTGLPLVADLHNITSEELVASNIIQNKSKAYYSLNKTLAGNLLQTDSVVVVSQEMKEYVKYLGIPSCNIRVVPPGGRDRGMVPKPYPLKITYSGLLSKREHVDLFLKSIPIMEKKIGATFHLTKKGEMLKNCQALAKKLDIKPTFFWYANEQLFYKFLASCHVGILTSSNDLARKMGTPVKLFDYLSAGLPVVANDIGAWTKIIEEENVGVLTEDDPVSFAKGITRLVSDPSILAEYSERCVNLVKKKYNWAISAKILFDTYVQAKRC